MTAADANEREDTAGPTVTRRGSIEIKTYARSKRVVRLVACPFCEDYEFGYKEPRWRHFLEEHGPEDAGLSPLNERRDSPLATDGGTEVIR